VCHHEGIIRQQLTEDLVTSFQKIASTMTLAICAASWIAFAADTQQNTEAEAVANAAIAQLAGWQTQAARKTLEAKKEKFGSNSDFKTAWALLEIQEATVAGKPAPTASTGTLSQMAKAQSVDAAAQYWQGELFYQQSKNNEANAAWQAAAKTAEKLVAADPTDATAQFYLGAALVRQKKFDPALKALRLAVRGGFDEAMVNYQIGFMYLLQQKWQEAKDAFDVGLKVNPRFAPMYYWRAMAWEKLGRKDNMLLDFDQFVKLAPKAPEANKARAILKSAG
jgi:tetratricopeptide (TPR) repeat protein